MVKDRQQTLDQVFQALSDPTRRAIVRALAKRERTAGELATPFDMSLAAVSKHLKLLEEAGLMARRVEGRTHYCRLNPRGLERAQGWLSFYERFWSERLDQLAEIVSEDG
ncbi:MAG: transcriptional regulator [Proteobacteria bacterium]|nr:MAG: transcriptional regulator [Pseudomonadota bacterium]